MNETILFANLNTMDEVYLIEDLYKQLGITDKVLLPSYFASRPPHPGNGDPLASVFVSMSWRNKINKVMIYSGYRRKDSQPDDQLSVHQFANLLRIIKASMNTRYPDFNLV